MSYVSEAMYIGLYVFCGILVLMNYKTLNKYVRDRFFIKSSKKDSIFSPSSPTSLRISDRKSPEDSPSARLLHSGLSSSKNAIAAALGEITPEALTWSLLKKHAAFSDSDDASLLHLPYHINDDHELHRISQRKKSRSPLRKSISRTMKGIKSPTKGLVSTPTKRETSSHMKQRKSSSGSSTRKTPKKRYERKSTRDEKTKKKYSPGESHCENEGSRGGGNPETMFGKLKNKLLGSVGAGANSGSSGKDSKNANGQKVHEKYMVNDEAHEKVRARLRKNGFDMYDPERNVENLEIWGYYDSVKFYESAWSVYCTS